MPNLSEWTGAEGIAAALQDLGFAEAGSEGPMPITWHGLRAWAELTMPGLAPGDYEALRRLSVEYVVACNRYRHTIMPPPFGAPLVDRNAAQEVMRRALDALVSSNGRRRRK